MGERRDKITLLELQLTFQVVDLLGEVHLRVLQLVDHPSIALLALGGLLFAFTELLDELFVLLEEQCVLALQHLNQGLILHFAVRRAIRGDGPLVGENRGEGKAEVGGGECWGGARRYDVAFNPTN